MTTETTTIEDKRIPDDSARLARAQVERLTELLKVMPGNWYYETCLRQWLHELAHPTRYKGEDDERTE